MVAHYIAQNANPELRVHLRKANEARAATFYAVWRALTAPLRRLAEAVRRAERKRATAGALSRLSDHHLADIGISRSEISGVADAIARQPLAAGLTIAELRRTESFAAPRRNADLVELPQPDARRVADLHLPDRIAS